MKTDTVKLLCYSSFAIAFLTNVVGTSTMVLAIIFEVRPSPAGP
jgi:hypothetical protein